MFNPLVIGQCVAMRLPSSITGLPSNKAKEQAVLVLGHPGTAIKIKHTWYLPRSGQPLSVFWIISLICRLIKYYPLLYFTQIPCIFDLWGLCLENDVLSRIRYQRLSFKIHHGDSGAGLHPKEDGHPWHGLYCSWWHQWRSRSILWLFGERRPL